jgi:vacuolar protein sorting-associated protein 54
MSSSHDRFRAEERRRALEEAAFVIDCCNAAQNQQLDGFNLLGVVADPRFGGVSTAVSSNHIATSVRGRYGTSGSRSSEGPNETSSTSSYFDASYYYQSLESTLSSVTGQVEALNHALEDWSRQLLDDGDNSLEKEKIPESQLRELPPHIEQPDIISITAYLKHSSTKANAFQSILQNDGRQFDQHNDGSHSLSASSEPEEWIDVSSIPALFFQQDFDLSDPTTFRELILISGNDMTNDAGDIAIVGDPLPLISPEALSGHLDKIEMALLQQVRSNSDKFFAESQRFALLQEWIQSLIVQVAELQASHRTIQANLLQPMEIVPVADAVRSDLRKLEWTLERSEDMLLCKHGLGGVLSAQDDLTAIEQIQYGRCLLDGTWGMEDAQDQNEAIELRRLHSFKAVTDQLNQYEQVVVSNLRDELIEVFLSWTSSSNHDSVLSDSAGLLSPMRSSNTAHILVRVREIFRALQICKSLSSTKEAYSSRLQDVIRMTVRTTVGEFAADVAPQGAVQSVAMGASSMTLNRFLDCLDMIFEQILSLLHSAHAVSEFCLAEGFYFQDESGLGSGEADNSEVAIPNTPLLSVVAAASELSSKSISELLRLRKDAHSLVTLGEMKSIWDACSAFALQIENLGSSGHTSTLRTTLLAQAKSFVERRHESNMSSLAAALDSERWIQCEVSAGRQDAVSRLCSGLSINATPGKRGNTGNDADSQALKHPELEVEGNRYKVVWSCLLLLEMVLANIATAAHFQSLSSNLVNKVSELLRLFNSRTTQLVLGAGAIHSHAKLKSINAKHLSLVTQCLGVIMAIIPHVRAGLMAQLPKKQHMLLNDMDQIRKEYSEHNENVLNKFVSIIGGIVEHGLAKTIPGTDFDARAESAPLTDGEVSCCVFLDGVSTNIRKMHQVLCTLLPPDHLIDTFSRIFAYVDNKVPTLFVAAANIQPVFQSTGNSPEKGVRKGQPTFVFPKSDRGKRQFLLEVEAMTKNLNGLEGVRPWDFALINVIERQLEYSMSTAEENDASSNPAMETSLDEDPLANDDVASSITNVSDKENGTVDLLNDVTVQVPPASDDPEAAIEEPGDHQADIVRSTPENDEGITSLLPHDNGPVVDPVSSSMARTEDAVVLSAEIGFIADPASSSPLAPTDNDPNEE